MGEVTTGFSYRKMAGLGFLLILPALLFVTAAVLKYGLGWGYLFDALGVFYSDPSRRLLFNLISPILFLGGLFLAMLLNAYPVLHFGMHREEGRIAGTFALQLRLWNLAILLIGFALLAILISYALTENFLESFARR